MTITDAGHAAALWTGLHLLLLLVLSLLVVRQRQRHKVAHGDEGIPELARAIRAQANATEYIPAGLAGLIVLALAGAPPVMVHIAGFALLAGRVIHAFGLSNTAGTSMGRTVGMILTWLAYIFLAVTALLYAAP